MGGISHLRLSPVCAGVPGFGLGEGEGVMARAEDGSGARQQGAAEMAEGVAGGGGRCWGVAATGLAGDRAGVDGEGSSMTPERMAELAGLCRGKLLFMGEAPYLVSDQGAMPGEVVNSHAWCDGRLRWASRWVCTVLAEGKHVHGNYYSFPVKDVMPSW